MRKNNRDAALFPPEPEDKKITQLKEIARTADTRFDVFPREYLSDDFLKRKDIRAIISDSVKEFNRNLKGTGELSVFLIFACICGSQNTAEYIINLIRRSGTNEDLLPSKNNNDPLYYALFSGNKNLCDLLVNKYGCQYDSDCAIPIVLLDDAMGGNGAVTALFKKELNELSKDFNFDPHVSQHRY